MISLHRKQNVKLLESYCEIQKDGSKYFEQEWLDFEMMHCIIKLFLNKLWV